MKKYIYQIQILFEIRSTSASAIHNVLQRILSSFMLLPFAGSISQVCSKMTLVRVCVRLEAENHRPASRLRNGTSYRKL